MSAVVADARWNTWVRRAADDAVVSFLEPGRDYAVHLDLSRHAYTQLRSAVAGSDVKELIRREIAAGKSVLRLKVRPRLVGESLRRPAGAPAEFNLDLALARLRVPEPEQARREAERLVQAGNRMSEIPRLSRELGAGAISVPVSSTLTPGCAQLVFSIWDESGLRPLDHLVHTLSVREAGRSAPLCEDAALQGGFKSLTGVLSGGGVQADAALHLIEVPSGSGTDTIALFVDAARYARAQADPAIADRGLYGWQIERPFSMASLVGEQHELLDLINGARQSGSYRLAAQSLANRIFTATRETEEQARSAVFALRALRPVAGAPVLMLRATTARDLPVYLPLGLLGAHDAGLLPRRLTVVHPLPREDYGDACIDRWTLGIPRTLEQVNSPVSLPDLPSRMSRTSTLAELKQFFSGASSPLGWFSGPAPAPGAGAAAAPAAAGPATSEALVLLAHQAEGKLWFTDSGTGERIETTDLRRRFPRGSVAILAACSTANPKGDNQALLERLNRQGIDAVVASSFPIEASLGVELARAFVEAGRSAYAAGRTPELHELFDSAMDLATARLGAQAPARDKSLEFMILGNHQLRLCR